MRERKRKEICARKWVREIEEERERALKGKGKLQRSKSFLSRNNCNHSRCQNPLDPSSRPDGNFTTGVKAVERGLEVVWCECVCCSLFFYIKSAFCSIILSINYSHQIRSLWCPTAQRTAANEEIHHFDDAYDKFSRSKVGNTFL